MGEHEEPLDQWADRRDRRRESDRQITGRRRAEPLDPTARGRAAHLAPDAPRMLLERTTRPASGCRSESPTTPPRPRSSSPVLRVTLLEGVFSRVGLD
ncbi:DUF6087 family protein [Streptomyces sp. NPDC059957]|uniref:DUF6087 family protein n=1 Tax=Streptomyces sp. NPDC059957 TaxID=3347016 RepID=UPI0036680A3D